MVRANGVEYFIEIRVPSEEQIVLIATILLSLSYVALAMAHNLTMIYVAMIPNSLAIR